MLLIILSCYYLFSLFNDLIFFTFWNVHIIFFLYCFLIIKVNKRWSVQFLQYYLSQTETNKIINKNKANFPTVFSNTPSVLLVVVVRLVRKFHKYTEQMYKILVVEPWYRCRCKRVDVLILAYLIYEHADCVWGWNSPAERKKTEIWSGPLCAGHCQI